MELYALINLVVLLLLVKSKQRHDRNDAEAAFRHRAKRQCRAIRRYARKLGCDENEAALKWCINGLAEKWAKSN